MNKYYIYNQNRIIFLWNWFSLYYIFTNKYSKIYLHDYWMIVNIDQIFLMIYLMNLSLQILIWGFINSMKCIRYNCHKCSFCFRGNIVLYPRRSTVKCIFMSINFYQTKIFFSSIDWSTDERCTIDLTLCTNNWRPIRRLNQQRSKKCKKLNIK